MNRAHHHYFSHSTEEERELVIDSSSGIQTDIQGGQFAHGAQRSSRKLWPELRFFLRSATHKQLDVKQSIHESTTSAQFDVEACG